MNKSSKKMKKQICVCAMLLVAAVWVAGCGNEKEIAAEPDSANSVPVSSENNAAAYPKTISIAGKDVTIPKKPEKIAAISLDSADTALELVDPERMALVSKSITDSSLAYRTAEGEKVKSKIAGATSLDPEQVLSSNADLLIMTKLHDKEKEANAILEQSGIPIITLESWSTLESVMNNIMVIGQAVGEEAKAESIVADMRTKLEKTTKAIEAADRPSVLVVSPLGPGTGPYLMGSSNISYDLVRLAGAEHAAESLGLKRTTKASIEQIMKADPEYILLVEWQEGKTDDMNEITQTPGWSTLKAVKNNHVLSMPARKLLNPNRYNVDTLEEIAKWLHPDKF